jgi:glycosyltransferase involved in cell wall biosynthesis
MDKGISVIICCYNSASRLPVTLKHLSQQNVDLVIPWEVIVVDNNSSDNTANIALSYWNASKTNTPLRVIEEKMPGLSFARKKGIREAQYEYIIFCDDDNWLSDNYIQQAYNLMEQHHFAAAFGGQSEAVSDIPIPEWFNNIRKDYAVGRQAEKTGIITARGYLWGAGLIFRKSVYKKAEEEGFKSYLIDRKGQNLSSGGDSELCKWFILLGYELWYDSELYFKHFIPKERLNKEYRDKMRLGIAKSDYWLRKYDILIKIRSLKNNRLVNFFTGCRYILSRNENFSPTYKQFLLGPYIKITDDDNFSFIKRHNRFIYNRN